LSKLIVGCGYSKISCHFCKDCRIFREGVKDSTIGISSNNGLVSSIGLGLVSFIGFGLISTVGLSGFGLVGLSGINGLIVQIGLAGFVGLSGFDLISLVGIIGFNLVSLSGINDLVGLDSLVAAIIAAEKFLVAMATQAAAAKTHGVAIKLASATKITNAAIWYYCAALLVLLSLIWRESGLWCEW
jgi:hypothetical protein